MTDKAKRPAKATKAASETVVAAIPASEAVKSQVAGKDTPIAAADKASKGAKHKKPKMVRDSFTMPEMEYAQIAALKARCLRAGVSAKKSEVLRAALKTLSNLSDRALTKAIADLEPIKTGRPAKSGV